MAEARAAYRAVLRAVDRNVTAVTGSTQWRDHIAAAFRRQAAEGDAAAAAAAAAGLQQAKDYAFLLNSIREQKVGWGVFRLTLRTLVASHRRCSLRGPCHHDLPPHHVAPAS